MRFLTDLFIERCFYWTVASAGLFGCYEFSRADSTFKARKKGPATQLDTTTIAEAHRSLSCEARAGRGLGRGAPSIELTRLIGIPSPLPLPTPPSWGEGIDQRYGGRVRGLVAAKLTVCIRIRL